MIPTALVQPYQRPTFALRKTVPLSPRTSGLAPKHESKLTTAPGLNFTCAVSHDGLNARLTGNVVGPAPLISVTASATRFEAMSPTYRLRCAIGVVDCR